MSFPEHLFPTARAHRDRGGPSTKAVLKTLYFLGVLAEMVIRIPHERRRRKTRMAVERVGALERVLVGLLFVGMVLANTRAGADSPEAPAGSARRSWPSRFGCSGGRT